MLDENDITWAANYIEEQQTQLILSILTDDGEKPSDRHDDSEHEVEEEYKSLRPTLATLGSGECAAKTTAFDRNRCFDEFPLESSAGASNFTTATASRHPHVVLDFPEWRPSIDLSNDDLDLTGIDDNEIDEMILTRDETKLKLKSWLRENKDWFLEEKRRQRNKEAAEQKKTGSSGMAAAQRRKRKKKAAAAAAAANDAHKTSGTGGLPHGHLLAGFNSMTPAGLAAAAHSALQAEKQSQDKLVSSKINYDVLKKLTMKRDEAGQQAASSAVTITNESERTSWIPFCRSTSIVLHNNDSFPSVDKSMLVQEHAPPIDKLEGVVVYTQAIGMLNHRMRESRMIPNWQQA